ncbi:MAG: hypothetical protein IT372_09900 [Polyangiaceae bacterium]|nr:hypothetical protein [Polyangiaceae bacterium]
MGQLDQFAKRCFADDTAPLTGGGATWDIPPEIGLTHVQGDGLILVQQPGLLSGLPAPWSEAARVAEILVEVKMCRDRFDVIAYERAVLRRQARQVQLSEAAHEAEQPWPPQEGLWVVGSHLPRWLHGTLEITTIAPGCYRLGPSWFQMVLVAANELPLLEVLIPFLIARSGRALDEFARWVASRRPLEWVMDMLQSLDMSDSVREDLMRRFGRKDDPVVEARRQGLLRAMLADTPEVKQELIEEGIEKGIEKGIGAGRLAEARSALGLVLSRRGLALGPEQEAKIAACEDLATLERWLGQAITAATAADALM